MDAVRVAWEVFHEGERGSLSAVRPAILASWRRSRALAVSPDLRVARPARRPPRRERASDERFAAVGGAVTRRLADELTGAGCVVALADRHGTVLDRAGDRALTARTDAALMVPGAGWSEAAAGTNGLSLALALGRPSSVLAAEHFCAGWHSYGCSAAPIHDPATRELLGALVVTTPARVHDARIAGALATRTAREIEHGLTEDGRRAAPRTLQEIEREAIMQALEAADGSVSDAAETLGISRATLYRRLRTYRALG